MFLDIQASGLMVALCRYVISFKSMEHFNSLILSI
jgi:hypothetical protein